MHPLSPTRRHQKSAKAFEQAKARMPGGVSSPVRAFKAVGRDPVFIQHGKGAIVTDIDGNSYIDYVMSYGPLILGHAHESVVAAIAEAAGHGTSFGMPTEAETRLAELVISAVPSIELIRFVNSGTEAVMSAIRLARGSTGRAKVVKCTGCYHGHSDSLLVEAGSGATTLGVPSSAGVPTTITQDTVLVPYNDLNATRRVFESLGHDIACMVVEPVAGNMGVVPPVNGYLQGLRSLCDEHGSLLIFDEVMTGFRVAHGGAQSLYGITPDLTCLGKIIGGGLPCAAYGGPEKIMRQAAPDGPVYQAGTLSGNPLAMAAGIATLEALQQPGVYDQLEARSAELESGLRDAATAAGIPVSISRVGSMLCVFFSKDRVMNYQQALNCRTDQYAVFFNAMLDAGVMLAPSQYEAWFISTAHDPSNIENTVNAASRAFQAAASVD